MGKFSDILFTSDFDHTISDANHKVPQANIDVIEYFIRKGGLFCLNSGRSVPLMRCRVDQIPTNAPCLCYNGAACYDYNAERLIYAHPLPEFATQLIDLIAQSGVKVCMEVQRLDNHYEIGEQLPSRLRFLKNEGLEPIFCDKTAPLPWMKLIVCGASGQSVMERLEDIPAQEMEDFLHLQAKIEEFCDGKCYVTRSMPRLIEISNPSRNKGSAARELAAELNRRILVCAGDAPNDEQMLREADFAFCPSDADASIRALPRVHICASSEVGCIADAVKKLEEMLC